MTRPITAEEVAIVCRLPLFSGAFAPLSDRVHGSFVTPMNDGGMGSLRFASNRLERRAKQVSHGRARDIDGVQLDLTINVDQDGDLFELDIWKVDFSPIQRFPRPDDIEPAAGERE
jgi:hypothetical protein